MPLHPYHARFYAANGDLSWSAAFCTREEAEREARENMHCVAFAAVCNYSQVLAFFHPACAGTPRIISVPAPATKP